MLGNVGCAKKVQSKTIIDNEWVETELAGCVWEGIFSVEYYVNLCHDNFTKTVITYNLNRNRKVALFHSKLNGAKLIISPFMNERCLAQIKRMSKFFTGL